MPSQDQYPSSGAQPSPPGGWQPYPPPVPAQNYPVRAAHKPGAMPLRPLGLGDVLDAAVRIIRHNPGATIGAAALLSAIPLLLPVIVTALAAPMLGSGLLEAEEISFTQAQGLISVVGSWVGALGLQWLGAALVTGMVAQVAHAAALGHTVSLAQAWRATHGLRWRLVFLTLLLGLMSSALVAIYVLLCVGVVMSGSLAFTALWFLVSLPVLAAVMFWFWIRVYVLAVPALMIERCGVIEAITRGSSLTSGHFWRLLGIMLLAWVGAQVAASMLGFPLALLGQLPAVTGAGEATTLMTLTITQAASMVLSAALTTPFLAAVTSLLYIDMRIRKEAFDVELLTRSESGLQ